VTEILMLAGAGLQMIGGLISWSATRVEMDEIMVHGRVRKSEFEGDIEKD